jgi:hypothetical protein
MNSTVIDSNDTFKKFDFSSLIAQNEDQEACDIIRQIVSQGHYFSNSPRYQTKENLFSRAEPLWLKYRMSFLLSVFLYLGREVRVSNMMAWSYMTNLSSHENREKLWHNHWHLTNPDAKIMSGIWYLHIPSDVKDSDYCGTEMAPEGPENEGKFFVRPSAGQWLIYPGDQWHRPGISQSDQYRFIIAADVEYLP